MSVYTMKLKTVIDFHGDAWLNNYPIFDESHREALNEMICDTYWNREIAHETEEMFFMAFRVHMRKNMPFFNEMYRASAIEFDPLSTVKMTTTGQAESETDSTSATDRESNSDARLDAESTSATAGTSDDTSTTARESDTETTSTNDSEGLTVGYQFPQTRLSGAKDYASSATDSSGTATTAGTGSESGTDTTTATGSTTSDTTDTGSTTNITDTTETVSSAGKVTDVGSTLSTTEGYQGNPAEILKAFRDSLVNVDDMVVSSLEPLFMGIWGTQTRRIGRR